MLQVDQADDVQVRVFGRPENDDVVQQRSGWLVQK